MQINTRLTCIVLLCTLSATINSNAQVNWYWTRQADSATENASQVAADRKDNVYYTGYFNGGARVAFGNVGLSLTGTQDDFLAKYSSTGVPIWARNAKALANSALIYGMAVATDRNNNVVEAGYYNDSIAFGAVHLSAKTASESSYLVKYSQAGAVLWAATPIFSHSSLSYAYGTATDKENNVFLAGYYQDTVIFGKDTLACAGTDFYLVKYDQTGNVLWARTGKLGAGASAYALSVAVDDSGAAFIAGNISALVTFGPITLNGSGNPNVYLAKYDSAGNVKWAVNTGALPGQLTPTPVAVDKSNNCYVAAQFENSSLTFGPSTVTDLWPPCSNSLLAKYDRNGNPLWATCARNVSQNEVCVIVESSIATDKCKNVYWSGFASDTFSVGCVNVTVPGANINQSKAFTYFMRLDSAGKPFCGVAMNNQSSVFFSNGLATDSLSRVLFCGDLFSPATLVLGKDTVKRYQSQATCFLSKFSIVPIILGNDTICPGDSTVLTVKLCTGSTYQWSTGATTDSITVKPLTTTTYFLTTNNCNTDTSFITVTVTNTKPLIKGKDSICKGDAEWLVAGGGGTYKWSNNQTTDSINVAPASTTTYTLTVKNGGCVKDTTFTVNVKPLPVPTINPNPDSSCAGLKVVLTGGGGGTYKWSTGGTYDTAQLRVGTYTLTVTKNGCSASVSETIFNKSPIPVITILSKNNICSTDSTTITARGGTAYKWEPGGSTDSIIHILPGFSRTYSVYITTPCGVDTLTQPVNVLPAPNVQTSPDTIICNTTSAKLRVSGGSTYSWTPSSTLTCNTCPNPTASPTVTTTYSITVTGANGCFKDTTITVTVKNKTGSITPNQKICTGTDVPLTAGPPGDTYKWSTGATTSSITVSPLTNTCYTVIVSNGCPDTLQTCLTVKPLPKDTAYFIPSGLQYDTINKGDTAWMVAQSNINTYLWTPAFDLSCTTCPNPMATPTVTTTYTLTSDSGGCITQKTLTVYVEVPCADFKVPNVFTPNNDGRNDDFVVNVLNPTSYSIQIFDRWGKEVYTSTNPTQYWTGHILSTQDMVADGVYFYTIKASCGTSNYSKQGFVQVLSGGK